VRALRLPVAQGDRNNRKSPCLRSGRRKRQQQGLTGRGVRLCARGTERAATSSGLCCCRLRTTPAHALRMALVATICCTDFGPVRICSHLSRAALRYQFVKVRCFARRKVASCMPHSGKRPRAASFTPQSQAAPAAFRYHARHRSRARSHHAYSLSRTMHHRLRRCPALPLPRFTPAAAARP
jgi:hypothetical protein